MKRLQMEEIREIYNLFSDDLSKYIFENRLMYSLTMDTKFMRNVVRTVDRAKEIYIRLKENKRKVGIFGAGYAGKYLFEAFKGIEFECYIDNKCYGGMCKGLPIISWQEFKEKYPEGIVMISSKLYHKEILQQLLDEGFPEKDIINAGKAIEELKYLQYFDLPQLEEKRQEKEIFIDAGCYDGNTSIEFFDWCQKKGHVYAWEPDPLNFEKCEQLFRSKGISYQLIPKGLWSEPKELKMKMGGDCSTITDKDWDISIGVDSIDRLIEEPATFIKMDIEGSEFEALLGAEKMISQHKPKLAICVYHKPEDIWEIPCLIHKFNPEYRFYLRHYAFSWNETVLYAL